MLDHLAERVKVHPRDGRDLPCGRVEHGPDRFGQGPEHIIPMVGDHDSWSHAVKKRLEVAGGVRCGENGPYHDHVGGRVMPGALPGADQNAKTRDIYQEAEASIHAVIKSAQRGLQIRG